MTTNIILWIMMALAVAGLIQSVIRERTDKDKKDNEHASR